MNTTRLVLATTGILLAAAAAQARSPASQPARGKSTGQPGPRILKFQNMQVDLAAGKITLDASVCLRQGQLELLLCKKNSKEHESILHTTARPAHLHAALLALDLTPGIAAEWAPLANAGKGALLPPRGARVSIQLHWKDKNGRPRQAEAAQWMVGAEKRKDVAMPTSWVFVGSDALPDGRYWADADGDIISVANFASAVIDVPFQSSDKNALLSFQANTAAIPPLKTAVQVVITPVPGAKRAPHARATLHVDRLGQLRMGPKAIALDDLTPWCRKFVDRHAVARIVVRTDPMTRAHDIALVRRELEAGRIPDIRVEHGFLYDGMLPRTEAGVDRALKKWKEKFAKGTRLLIDPAEESAETLARLRAAVARTKAQNDARTRYRRELAKAREQYKASTQPATDAGATRK